MAAHVVALATCVTADRNGVRVRLQEGTVWDANDPFVLFRPELFARLDEERGGGVEAATANPGEKRRPGRPRKTAE